jgi:leucyl-tRNA synthetase
VNDVIVLTPEGFSDAIPDTFSQDALALRKVMHRMLAAVADDVEKLAFNRSVARIYDATNAIGKALAAQDGAAQNSASDMIWALREAVSMLVEAMQPMTPHLAEACWAALGNESMLATKPWSEVDRSLLDDDTLTLTDTGEREEAR